MMDLTPFFTNVERIATALETIARNGTPVDYSEVRHIVEARGPRVDVTGTEGRTRPREFKLIGQTSALGETVPPVDQADVTQGQASAAHGQILGLVRRIYEDGTKTANGIAVEMKKRGIPHPRGLQWNNRSAKLFMDELGLKSPFESSGGRGRPKVQAEDPSPVEAAPEPDPDPAPAGPEAASEPDRPVVERRVNRAFVEREFQPRRTDDGHMNFRGLLSAQTREKLEAHEKAQAAERAMIDEAIAAGKVTKLPAGLDSEGINHLEADNSGFTKSGGPSFGPNTGSRVNARGSNF